MARRKADPRIIVKRDRFKNLRLAKGVSQRGVGLELGVSESFIRAIEYGLCNPELGFAFRLAAYFETSVDDLFQDLKGNFF